MKYLRYSLLSLLFLLFGNTLSASGGLAALAEETPVAHTDTKKTGADENAAAAVSSGGGLAGLAEEIPVDTTDDSTDADVEKESDEDEEEEEPIDEEPLVILSEEEEVNPADAETPALPGQESAEEVAAIELSEEEAAKIQAAATKGSATLPADKTSVSTQDAKLITDSDWNIEASLETLKKKTGAGIDLPPEDAHDKADGASPAFAQGPDDLDTGAKPEEESTAKAAFEEFSAEFDPAALPTTEQDTPPTAQADDEFLAEQAAKRAAAKPSGPAFTAEETSVTTETEDLGDDLEAMLDAAEAEAATMPSPEESEEAKAADKAQRKENKAEQTKAMKLMAAAAEKEKTAYLMQLKGLREAGVDINANGMAFTGKFQLWGGVYARLTAALNTDGFLAQGYIPELTLGPLKVTGAGPDGKYGTDDDGVTVEARISKKLTRVMASGMIDLILNKAHGDIMFGTSGVTVFTALKILGVDVKFLGEISGKGSNLDFVVQGAADADLIRILEEELTKSIDFLANTTQEGVKKAQRAVKKIRTQLKHIKQESTNLSKKFKRAKKRLDEKTKAAAKILGPPRKLVQKTTNQMEKVKRATWKVRRAIAKARRKMLRGLRKAFDKVLRTKKSKANAKKKYRQAKRKAKWYKPWTYVAVAFWASSLAIVTAIHAVAESVYIAIRSAINVVPIDLIPPLPAMWATYAAAKVACFSAIQALTAARLAANPLAAKEMLEMTGLAIAIAGIEYAHAQMYVRLSAALKALDLAHAAVSVGGEFAKAATEVGALAMQFAPILIMGAGFKFSLRELAGGKMPMIGLVARVFGTRRVLTAQIDYSKPQTILTALPKMLVQTVAGGGDDFITKMESINMKHAKTLEGLEKKKKALKQSQAKWEEKKKQSLESRERIIAKGKEEAARVEAASIKQGEGEYGKKLDLSAMEAKGAGGGTNSSDDFDPKNPSSYACEDRNYAFRWNEHWVLPTKNSGAVTFTCSGVNEIIIGLNASPKAKSLSRLYDIVIGFDENKGTVIRKLNEKGVPVTLVESRDPQARNKAKDENDYDSYPYWISYHEGYIACGHGTKLGENIIVEWRDEAPPEKVKSFAFSSVKSRLSFSEITAQPAFHRPFGSQYSLYDNANNFVWRDEWKLPESGNGTITFKAKAARDIKVGFSDDTTTKHADYIADIGMDDNTRSSLVEVTPDGKEYHRKALSEDPDILVKGDNKTYEYYWVTHNKGHLAYGTGKNPRENIALEWVDRTPLAGLTHFSFSSWDNPVEIRDIKVQPAVEIPVGSRYSAVNRKGTFEWRPEWQLFEKDKAVIRFRTKGKESLILGLHAGEGKPTESTFKLVIGGNKNTRTFVTDASGKELGSTIDPDAVIQDAGTFNDFWVLYEKGFMALGFGDTPGKKMVFEAELPEAPPITHFSFSNDTGYIEYQKIESVKAVTVTRAKRYTANKTNGSFAWRDSWQLPKEGGVVLFEALADADLHIGLHTGIGAPTDYTFDVILGAQGNLGSRIHGAGGTQLNRENSHKARLHNTRNYTPYWLIYNPKERTLSAGRGATPGEERMVFYKMAFDAKIPVCTHFSFASGASEITFRRIGGFAKDDPKLVTQLKKMHATTTATSLVQTELEYAWNRHMKLKQKNRGVIYFKARSGVESADKSVPKELRTLFRKKDNKQVPRDIHIAFNHDPEAGPTSKDYVVVLNEEQSKIKRHARTVQRSTSDAHLISDSHNFYPYWISYDHGHIAVGRGATAGKQIILEWSDKHPLKNIEYFALAGAERFKDIRSEKLTSFARNTTYVANNRKKKFEWLKAWRLREDNRGLITFTAVADRNIHVGIGRNDDTGYRLVIGADNNKKIELYQGRRLLKSAEYAIPQSSKPQHYWLNFDRGALKCGQGRTPGKNIIFEHINLRHTGPTRNFSFSSDTNQVSLTDITSHPVIEGMRSQSNYTANKRKGRYEWKLAWKAPLKDSFTVSFKAKGKDNIMVGLHTQSAEKGAREDEKSYEVVIGAEGNKTTFVRDARNEKRAENKSGGARITMPDEFNEYWVTYHKGRVMFGSGSEPGQSTHISWVDSRPVRKVKYISFSSYKEKVEYKDIVITKAILPDNLGSTYLSNGEKGSYTWSKEQRFTDRRHWALTFSARGAKDALIGFNTKVSGAPTYQIALGNEQTAITAESRPKAVITHDKAALLEDEYTAKTFWVNYSNGVLSFGGGDTPGRNELLSHTFPDNGRAIAYYGFSSKDDAINYRDIAVVKPVETPPYSTVYRTKASGTFTWEDKWAFAKRGTGSVTFKVKGDGDALIGLHSQKRGNPSYRVTLGAHGNKNAVLHRNEGVRRDKAHEVAKVDNVPLKATPEQYWINCLDGTLTIGKGEIGTNVLLSTTEKRIGKLTNISFSSLATSVVFSDITFRDAVDLVKAKKAAEKRAAILKKEKPKLTEAEAAVARVQSLVGGTTAAA